MSAITLKCQIEPDSGEKRTQTCAPPSPATKCVCVCVCVCVGGLWLTQPQTTAVVLRQMN